MSTFDLKPPNLNAELYKNHQDTEKTFEHLSFIAIHTDGTTIVGASDLIGRCWDGVIQISKSPQEFVSYSDNADNITNIFTSSGVSDGKFLKDPTKIIVAYDSGEINIWGRQKSWSDLGSPNVLYGWCITGDVAYHDSSILALDIFPNEDLCVTGGADFIIKVWDLEKLIPLMEYPAHSNIVTDVCCNPHAKSIFLSSSLDNSVALWHYSGTESRAKVFGKMPCAARCVSWISETLFAAGYDSGDVCFYDARYEGSEQVIPSVQLNYPIEKLTFNQQDKLLAICGDSSSVDVYKVSDTDSDSVYSNNCLHSHFVRGLEWRDNTLYSCGWDGLVVNHDISSNKSQLI